MSMKEYIMYAYTTFQYSFSNSRVTSHKRELKQKMDKFSITIAKAGSKQYAETMILLQLIIWIIAEHQAFLCECYLKEKNRGRKNGIFHI